jgi:hypothetical protein
MNDTVDALCMACLADGREIPIRWRTGEPRWCSNCYAVFLLAEHKRSDEQCSEQEESQEQPPVNGEMKNRTIARTARL